MREGLQKCCVGKCICLALMEKGPERFGAQACLWKGEQWSCMVPVSAGFGHLASLWLGVSAALSPTLPRGLAAVLKARCHLVQL